LFQVIQSKTKYLKEKKPSNRTLLFKVITKPDKADMDQSGTISAREALLLGIALALDAFGAGLEASIIGYPSLLTSLLIACMSGLFVYSGIKTGFFLSKMKKLQQMTYLPPILLIMLGLYNF